MDILFKDLLNEFEKSSTIKREELPKYRGIYVFYENDRPIYVGRANNIRSRIQWHTRKSSGSESASFAFNLAKMEFENNDETTKRKRADLMAISEFREIFDKHKLNLSNCKIKCIEIENDALQTMFEPYLSIKLGTYPINNTFENH
ncbi:MAG: GIY-YIG nuclease family protein [Bacteroidetes bacterium]|nr:GIY-YIG nuclease family protein [Bacteroidota bacterium]